MSAVLLNSLKTLMVAGAVLDAWRDKPVDMNLLFSIM
jgi:hypothetical protein